MTQGDFLTSADLKHLATNVSSRVLVSFLTAMFLTFANPNTVVQSPEDAVVNRAPAFDYVILCVKALPDVYNLADIVQSVVTPQHTCIIVNTTNTLGVEKQLEERFPTNVVLSLVSGANLKQLGSSEFEHSGSREIWVGPANLESRIPQAIQRDMSEALAMTLSTGQVDCKVSDNIRQQQYERMIGYDIHHLPCKSTLLTVIFQTHRIPPCQCHLRDFRFERTHHETRSARSRHSGDWRADSIGGIEEVYVCAGFHAKDNRLDDTTFARAEHNVSRLYSTATDGGRNLSGRTLPACEGSWSYCPTDRNTVHYSTTY